MFGVSFAVWVLVDGYSPSYSGFDIFYNMVLPGFFQGVLPGTAFVVVGIWAFREPTELARVLGAATGAMSGPLYYPLLPLAHPNSAGVDFGRAFVWLFMLALLAVNMRIGASVGERVARWPAGAGDVLHDALGPEGMRPLARAVGLGAVATALLILWLAHAETSPDPRAAHWELVHHGIVPAIPVAMVGLVTLALPARPMAMFAALVGVVPAVLCSSLVVDPDPANHGQTSAALVAYSLPVTLPITVGLSVLWADRLDERIREYSRKRAAGEHVRFWNFRKERYWR